ncbi:CdaR family protein [Romboutsia sp. 1001713B170131_170501_G6]|uniref:CdaR family protein n=1 Tax=Romboutsia sp. 1001713B170131_170501_G6 TaxID=2787108 RepID=UPI0018A9F1AD|nr:CdaR family protein [Romboutsia sp. 1001713B170131_170501_G6]
MMNKLKHNTKIKLISLLSAITLWLYVMAIVDPTDTKLFENVPIVVRNMNELKEKDFVIYPDGELTIDVSISGKLSKIQKVKKEDIHVYGTIENPMEGKNQVYLSATAPPGVTHELKSNVIAVNLDKIVQENKKIEVKIEGNSKDNIDKVSIDGDKKSIEVSGPRTLVNEVTRVIGVLDVGSRTQDFSDKIKLTPVDKNGNKVNGVKLYQSTLKVSATLLKEKTVPIRVKLKENTSDNEKVPNYELSKSNIVIKGSKDLIDGIEYIETKEVNLDDITSGFPKDVELNIPKGISSNTKYITIKLNGDKSLQKEFIYGKGEIELRNSEGKSTSDIDIPESVKVTVDYPSTIENLEKSDIKLYIDLSKPDENQKYKVEYDSSYKFNKIVIDPSEI